VAFSPDGRQALSGGYDWTPRVLVVVLTECPLFLDSPSLLDAGSQELAVHGSLETAHTKTPPKLLHAKP
jgi:hypothetical protein